GAQGGQDFTRFGLEGASIKGNVKFARTGSAPRNNADAIFVSPAGRLVAANETPLLKQAMGGHDDQAKRRRRSRAVVDRVEPGARRLERGQRRASADYGSRGVARATRASSQRVRCPTVRARE